MAPNQLFRHRKIYTGRVGTAAGDSPLTESQLVVDRAGRIQSSGEPGQLGDAIDLPGAAVVPGFIDTHAHLSSLGGGFDDLDLREIDSSTHLLKLIDQAASRLSTDFWITGTGWTDGSGWRDGLPTAEQLDRAAGGRPTLLFRRDRHALLASSSALALAGINDQTPDPPGGEIQRREGSLKPTGLLVDLAMELITAVVPEPSVDQLARESRDKALWLASLGVTCVHEAFVERQLWAGLKHLAERGRLPIRVRAMLAFDGDRVPTCERSERLRVIALKAFADGALGSRGAQLDRPYADNPTRGLAVQSDDELAELADKAERSGLQLAIHAIGDRGVGRALDLYEARAAGATDDFFRSRRWRLEHAQMVRPADLERVRHLCLAVQPIHFCEDASWTEARIGQERLPWSHRWRSLVDAGAEVGFGSDYPIESGDPIAAVRALVGIEQPQIAGWDRSMECLDRHAALDGYWRRAAYLAFDEGDLGRLEPGYLADFVCLSGDPFEHNGLDDLAVVATYVNGQCVYEA